MTAPAAEVSPRKVRANGAAAATPPALEQLTSFIRDNLVGYDVPEIESPEAAS